MFVGKYYNVPAVDDVSVSIAELRRKYEVSLLFFTRYEREKISDAVGLIMRASSLAAHY